MRKTVYSNPRASETRHVREILPSVVQEIIHNVSMDTGLSPTLEEATACSREWLLKQGIDLEALETENQQKVTGRPPWEWDGCENE